MKRFVILLLIVILTLCFAFTAFEAVHDCAGAECPICKIIAVLNSIFAFFTLSFVLVLCFSLISYCSLGRREKKTPSLTLIDLGVKLSA